VPLKRVGDHQELANLAAYLVSDFSAYVNGEVVVIDGGEWLKAGQFNLLEAIPEELWDQLEMMIKSQKRINKTKIIKECYLTRHSLFHIYSTKARLISLINKPLPPP
jgi:hypothetical protein